MAENFRQHLWQVNGQWTAEPSLGVSALFTADRLPDIGHQKNIAIRQYAYHFVH